MNRFICGLAIAAIAGGCSLAGQLTVKDYRASSGERVMAGQTEPKSEYKCQQISREGSDTNWGLKEGFFDKGKAIERITTAAVEAAPAKGANYAYVILPSSIEVGSINVNAWRDVYVAHYKCENLPAVK